MAQGFVPLLRYALYAASALAVLFVGFGLGAAVAFVLTPPEYTQADFEVPKKDVATDAPRGTAFEGTVSGGLNDAEATGSAGPAEEASFVHTATGGNSRGDYTYLSNPGIDGDPDAVVSASPAGSYEHNIGVWFEPRKQRWAIFNQDRAAVPVGAAFRVVVPPADRGFVHRAAPPNTVGNATYLDNPLVNGEPDAEVSVTQNWNPGGGGGVYNDHPVGVRYEEDEKRWAVYNRDEAQIRDRAAFNVTVLKGDDKAR